jgi:hypothetical protein
MYKVIKNKFHFSTNCIAWFLLITITNFIPPNGYEFGGIEIKVPSLQSTSLQVIPHGESKSRIITNYFL